MAVLLLTALALGAFLAINRPTTQASPDVTITVNSTADTNTRNSVMTLREAMLLATGDLTLTDLLEGECHQVSSALWSKGFGCHSLNPPGAASSIPFYLAACRG